MQQTTVSPCHRPSPVIALGTSASSHTSTTVSFLFYLEPITILRWVPGKSTLSDALLQLAGNISAEERSKGQVLDTLQVERERGITVKAQTASMVFEDGRSGERFLLNLVDTPGHIDFCHEVSRSLSSCQGALLLVDATQSVQAQTLANYGLARRRGLEIIPVITKVDLPNAAPEETALAMAATFKLDPEGVLLTSAKQGRGIKEVFEAIVDRLPSPAQGSRPADGRFFGRIVDSWFDEHRGVVCLVQCVGGSLREGQRVSTLVSSAESNSVEGKADFSVQEVGILTPRALRTRSLRTGEVGYVIAGMRSVRQVGAPTSCIIMNVLIPLSGEEWGHDVRAFGVESVRGGRGARGLRARETDDLREHLPRGRRRARGHVQRR